MADRLVSVDSETLRFPDAVSEQIGVDAEDRSTPLGGAVDRVARRAPFEPVGLSAETLAGLEPAGLSEATQTQLSATYAQQVSPSGDTTGAADTASIQAAINDGAARLKPGATYYVTKALGQAAALVIKSGSRIVATGATVKLVAGSDCPILADAGHASMLNGGAWTVTSEYSIEGGRWDRGANNGTGNGLHNVILGGTNFAISNMTFASTGGKYAVLVQNASSWSARNLHMDNVHSDGLHVQGPASQFDVRNINGTSGDDLFAITGADYAAYVWGNEGDVRDFTVDGIYPMNGGSRACIIVPGSNSGTDITVDKGSVRNIRGTMSASAQPGIIIGNDTSAPGTTNGIIGAVTLDGIALTLPNGSTRSLVQIRTQKLARSITIRNVSLIGDYAAVVIVSGGSLTGNVRKLTVDGVTGEQTSVPAQIVSTNSGVNSATIEHVVISNVLVSNVAQGGSFIRSSAGAGESIGRVSISNSIFQNCSWVADLATSTKVVMAAVQLPSANGVVSVRATGAVILTGSLDSESGVASVAAGGTLRVNGNIPIDLAKVNTRSTGDQARNTSAALSCGVGSVVTDGATWKNLYSGATYAQ